MTDSGAISPQDSTSPLRILMIISGYPPRANAGAERGCRRLSEALGRRGHHINVLTQAIDSNPTSTEEGEGLTVHRVLRPINAGPLWGISYMSQIRRWMNRLAGEWDIAMCHALYLHSVVASRVAEKLGKKCCTLLVNSGEDADIRYLREHRMGESLLKKTLRQDALFALSNMSAKEIEAEGFPPEKIWRYRYFFDLSQPVPVPASERKEFLYVGRFHEQKNVPGLIEAFTILHGLKPDARISLVGAGSKEEEVAAARENSSARDSITIRGWVDEPMELYRGAMALVSATRAEGLSNVMIESLGAGTPVIMPDISGVRDALDVDPSITIDEHYVIGKGGLVVKPGDREGLAKAMERLMEDRVLHQRLIDEAYSRARNYTEKSSVLDFERMMRLVMADKSAPVEHRGFSPHLFKASTP